METYKNCSADNKDTNERIEFLKKSFNSLNVCVNGFDSNSSCEEPSTVKTEDGRGKTNKVKFRKIVDDNEKDLMTEKKKFFSRKKSALDIGKSGKCMEQPNAADGKGSSSSRNLYDYFENRINSALPVTVVSRPKYVISNPVGWKARLAQNQGEHSNNVSKSKAKRA